MTARPRVFYCGDSHGRFDPVLRAVERHRPDAVVLLGDYDLDRPLHEVLAPVTAAGTEVYWISGNHEGDSDPWHDNAFGSALADRCIDGRVVEIGGHRLAWRVAGFGGVFRYKIWHPNKDPAVRTRAEFVAALPERERWRGGLPRRHRVSIWHEDYERLLGERAEVLVTHEAPTTMRRFGRPLGWRVIDRLAEALGVSTVFHGHHHAHYKARLASGITVHGVGLGAVVDQDGETIERPLPAEARA